MKKLFLTVFLFVCFAAYSFSQTTNEVEPNNAVGQSGVKTISSFGTYTGTVTDPSDNDDVWLIKFGSHGDINITVNNNGSGTSTQTTIPITSYSSFTTNYTLPGANLAYNIHSDNSPHVITLDGTKHYTFRVNVSSGTNLTVHYSFTLSSAGGELPVELSSFTGSYSGGKINLKWQTENEVNNYGFDIERALINSKNDKSLKWEKIGFIKGAGNSNSPKNYSFVDNNMLNGKLAYRLKQIDNNGNIKYSDIVEVSAKLNDFMLGQNYPNPFNPTTTIQYSIPKAAHVTLNVYNSLGKKVVTLVNANKEAGSYTVNFNGSSLSSGIYYYRITSGNFIRVKKLLLLK